MTLEDRNITYLTIDGTDPQLDVQHRTPEHILLRIFLAALYNSSNADIITVRGALNRESLERLPEWGVDGNIEHHFVCLAHKWNPHIVLR